MHLSSFRSIHTTSALIRSAVACLAIFVLAGCSETPTAPPAGNEESAKKELGPPPAGQTEPDVEYDSIELPNPAAGEKSVRDLGTKTLNETVDYYVGGPQQASPPDGQFPAGTEVQIVERAGSYTLVETADGVRAYVPSSAVGILE